MIKAAKSKRVKELFNLVRSLYENSEFEFSKWMWDNHVQWVADKAYKIAVKHNADPEKVYVGALLHDIGDVWFEERVGKFDERCVQEAERLLNDTGFSNKEIKFIINEIIEPHSCHEGNLPTTDEGKSLATADAMFHLQTGFFPQFSWKHIPSGKSYKQWTEWVTEKLDRDFNIKIFYDSERSEVKKDYEALKRVFVTNNHVK